MRCFPQVESLKGFLLALLFPWLILIPARVAAQAPPEMGWLGISISDVGEDLADRLAATFGPEVGTGALVVDVLKGGPAERAPLKRGDVIIRVDAQPIWDVRQLQRTIRSRPVNQRVMLTVLRESFRVTLPVIIGPMPVEARAQLMGERFGFLVREEEEERDQRRGQAIASGRIFVAFVDPGSPAARAGLQSRDVILRANDQPIQSLEDFERALRPGGRVVTLLVERGGAPAPIGLTLEFPQR